MPWPWWTALDAAAVVAAGTAAGVRAAAPDGTPRSTQAHVSAPPHQAWHTTATGVGTLLTPGQEIHADSHEYDWTKQGKNSEIHTDSHECDWTKQGKNRTKQGLSSQCEYDWTKQNQNSLS